MNHKSEAARAWFDARSARKFALDYGYVRRGNIHWFAAGSALLAKLKEPVTCSGLGYLLFNVDWLDGDMYVLSCPTCREVHHHRDESR
jgi:hypothetical protein